MHKDCMRLIDVLYDACLSSRPCSPFHYCNLGTNTESKTNRGEWVYRLTAFVWQDQLEVVFFVRRWPLLNAWLTLLMWLFCCQHLSFLAGDLTHSCESAWQWFMIRTGRIWFLDKVIFSYFSLESIIKVRVLHAKTISYDGCHFSDWDWSDWWLFHIDMADLV